MKKQELISTILFRLTHKINNLATKCNNLYHYSQLENSSLPNAKYIHTHMSVSELNTLYDLAKSLRKNSTALEIGSYLGASTCYLATALSLREGHLFCVDTWENQTMPEGEFNTFPEFQKNTYGVAKYITAVKKNSMDITISDIIYPLSFVFIDGDHSYEGVKKDYQKVESWIEEGGILAFHDSTYYQSVSKVVGDVIATGNWQIGGNVDSLIWLRKVGREKFMFPNPMS